MCCFKYNSAKFFAWDCTSFRNGIKTVMDSDQVHFTWFNIDSYHPNIGHFYIRILYQSCEGETM